MTDRIEEELLRRLKKPDPDPFQELRSFLDWYRENRPAPGAFDELIKRFEQKLDESDDASTEAWESALDILESRRPALEAETGVLRFKKDSETSMGEPLYTLIDNGRNEMLIYRYSRFYCENVAERLNLTAVFEEATNDTGD